jgi:ParB-like chromosome segregation protein Spo0J
MERKTLKLSELIPDPKNARVHDRRNLDLIKSSLKEFGQYRPFVLDTKGRY